MKQIAKKKKKNAFRLIKNEQTFDERKILWIIVNHDQMQLHLCFGLMSSLIYVDKLEVIGLIKFFGGLLICR